MRMSCDGGGGGGGGRGTTGVRTAVEGVNPGQPGQSASAERLHPSSSCSFSSSFCFPSGSEVGGFSSHLHLAASSLPLLILGGQQPSSRTERKKGSSRAGGWR